jgi:heat shock protein HslJ
MSSTATATTTTTTAKLKDRSSSSSASQKFWPLKKFNLHGKTAADEQQQSIALSQTNTVKASSPITAIVADGPAAKGNL